MQNIFICYRRADSKDVTGRIRDRLVVPFQSDGVFMDVHSIAPGVDYRAQLREVLMQCQVVLVVIGDSWLNIRDKHGKRCLDRPEDDVRIEIETALRLKLTVIPLLVGNTPMPCETELPGSIGALAVLQASRVRHDPDFDRDFEELQERIPNGPCVLALQSFAQSAGPMLRRIQARQQELARFACELNAAQYKLHSSPFGWHSKSSEERSRDFHDRSGKTGAIEGILECMSGASEHTTPFVNFAYYLDPQIGISLRNVEEVAQRFQELHTETQQGTKWADNLLGSLRNPWAPGDLARRGVSLIEEIRDQIKMIQSESASVAGIMTTDDRRKRDSLRLGADKSDSAVLAVKDEDAQRPIPTAWRPAFREVVKAIVNKDYRFSVGIPGVAPVSVKTAEQIEKCIEDYGETLVELSEVTWDSSICIWMGKGWDIRIDLWTKGEDRSDLVLWARVSESKAGLVIRIEKVNVP